MGPTQDGPEIKSFVPQMNVDFYLKSDYRLKSETKSETGHKSYKNKIMISAKK